MLHKRLSQRSKSPGAPTLLYIAGAALRVADVTRVLKNRRLRGDKGGDVAKLFAKHFKLEEHVAYLERSKIGSAAGTPSRVGKLLCDTGECKARGARLNLTISRRTVRVPAHAHHS
jgi:protein CMS1